MTTDRHRVTQRPVRGGRRRVSSALAKAINAAVEREAAHFHVSRSFVLAVAVATALGVPLDAEDDYHRPRLARRRAS